MKNAFVLDSSNQNEQLARKDSWSQDDDLLLADTCLRYIREGATQLEAFEEVADKLGRTASACGFRWNAVVRHKFDAAIQIAKQLRKESKKKNKGEKKNNIQYFPTPFASQDTEMATFDEPTKHITYDDVMRFLKEQRSADKDASRIAKQLREAEEKSQQLEEQNQKLQYELGQLRKEHDQMSEDFKMLINIMERSRKSLLLGQDEVSPKKTFRMDRNGNLEMVEV